MTKVSSPVSKFTFSRSLLLILHGEMWNHEMMEKEAADGVGDDFCVSRFHHQCCY